MSNVAAARNMLLVATIVTALFLVGCPPSNVTVPDVVGMTETGAAWVLGGAGLTLGNVTEEYSPTVPEGEVISQNPRAGLEVNAGAEVDLVISLGPAGSEGEGEGEGETIMLRGEVPLDMVWVEPGAFSMGRYPGEQDSFADEDPPHWVTLSSGFWMGKYELTKAQWTAVMATTPWSGQDYVLDDPDSPAVCVSWNDAQAFIATLTGLTGETLRLPTEAEWEYACRAGTNRRFYWGDDPSYTVGDDYAWWPYNAWDVNERYAHVVGLKRPNAFGLYDMSGNVWELCEDDWHDGYTGAPSNGDAWVDSPRGSARVRRGGSWNSYGDCRSARRGIYNPSGSGNRVGFRLAR